MADLKENQMSQISNPASLRCLDSAGNSSIVGMTAFINQLLGNNVSGNITSQDFNEVTPGMYYCVINGAKNAPYDSGYGVLIVYNIGGGMGQIYIPDWIGSNIAPIAIRTGFRKLSNTWKYISVSDK